jgi:hypothetical protein
MLSIVWRKRERGDGNTTAEAVLGPGGSLGVSMKMMRIVMKRNRRHGLQAPAPLDCGIEDALDNQRNNRVAGVHNAQREPDLS